MKFSNFRKLLPIIFLMISFFSPKTLANYEKVFFDFSVELVNGKSAIPKWNFHKILINNEGKIEDTFSSFTNPTSNKIISKIETLLNI